MTIGATAVAAFAVECLVDYEGLEGLRMAGEPDHVALSWRPGTDDKVVAEYVVQRNGVDIAVACPGDLTFAHAWLDMMEEQYRSRSWILENYVATRYPAAEAVGV